MASTTVTTTTTTTTTGKKMEGAAIFDMGSLKNHLPLKKRGLSRYFSGKSRSFACLADAKCVDDLSKVEIPDAKRMKYTQQHEAVFLPPLSCRIGTSNSTYCSSFVGV